MKKILLIILYVLGLGYTSSSLADVKNLPVICSVPSEELKKNWSDTTSNLKDYVLTNDPRESDILSGLSGKDLINTMAYLIEKRGLEPLDRNSFGSDEDYLEKIKAQYSLVKGVRAITKFDMVILKLIDVPKLILQHGFYNHEQKIKNLKLKCPSRSKMIKPYNNKYIKDKLIINPSYLSQIKKRIKARNNRDFIHETQNIIFMLYVLSLESHVSIDYEIIGEVYGVNSENIKKLHKTKAEKNGNKWIDINNRIIELDKNELKPEDFDKFSLNIALRNIPNICNTPNYITLSTGIQTQTTSLPKGLQDQNKNDIINFFKVLSEFPHLIFTQNFGYGTPRYSFSSDWCLAWNEYWDPEQKSFSVDKIIISKPFDEVALKKGEIKLRKAYLNHVKKLPQKDKENLKFLLNLIMLNPNAVLPESVDEKSKQKFNSNYAALLGAYDELKDNKTYRVVRTISRTRLVLKILLALL